MGKSIRNWGRRMAWGKLLHLHNFGAIGERADGRARRCGWGKVWAAACLLGSMVRWMEALATPAG